MNQLYGSIKNLWNSFYNTCFANVDMSVRVTIGIFLVVFSLIAFIQSMKGGKKSDLVGNWFWFWISMISFILSVLYLS